MLTLVSDFLLKKQCHLGKKTKKNSFSGVNEKQYKLLKNVDP